MEDLETCRECGRRLPREDMYGVAGDYRCPTCAERVRVRMAVRQRPRPVLRRPWVTVTVLIMCVGLYAAMRLVPLPRGQDPWFLLLFQDSTVRQGAFWKHFTAMFVHGGIAHLLFNAFSLWSIGRLVELVWGPMWMTTVLVLTGMGSMAVAYVFYPVGSVGISGAVFGLCGFLWTQRGHHPVATAVMTAQTRNWILMNLLLGFILAWTNVLPISNSGHVSGLALGLLLGVAARARKPWLPGLGVALVVVGCIIAAQTSPHWMP